jgi:hypothetical protein
MGLLACEGEGEERTREIGKQQNQVMRSLCTMVTPTEKHPPLCRDLRHTKNGTEIFLSTSGNNFMQFN